MEGWTDGGMEGWVDKIMEVCAANAVAVATPV